jgi:hypothetical protein
VKWVNEVYSGLAPADATRHGAVPSHLYQENSTLMCAGSQVRLAVTKLLSRRITILGLVALVILTTGATHSLRLSPHAQSAKVAHAERNVRPCFETLDLQGEAPSANEQALHVIANPYRPKVVVSFFAEAPVDSRRHNRPPPTV